MWVGELNPNILF